MMTSASIHEKDFKVTKTVALLPFLPKNSAQRSASEALLPVLPLTRDYLYSPGGFSGVHRAFVRFRPSHCAGVPQSP